VALWTGKLVNTSQMAIQTVKSTYWLMKLEMYQKSAIAKRLVLDRVCKLARVSCFT